MPVLSANLRGVLFMVLSVGFFSLNDALMKLATNGLPPFEVLCIRGIIATLWATPLVLATGNGPLIPKIVDRWVLLRNCGELISVLCFIVALANMPIADITALGQLAPMLLLIGVAVLYRDKIGMQRMLLIAVGFVGALLVAQPGANGVSPFALLGFGSALFTAVRDILGRRIDPKIPVLVVIYGTLITVMIGAGAASLVFEHPVLPELRHLLLLAGSGLLLTGGHFFIFLSYRTGATASVAPFYYMFAPFAVGTGFFFFHTLPNSIALIGIALILLSGVTIVLLDRRKKPLVELEPVA